MKIIQNCAGLALLVFATSAGLTTLPILQQSVEASFPTSSIDLQGIRAASLPHSGGTTDSFPSQAVILGVPFVPLGEVKQMDYAYRDILNPSIVASEAMILKYWGYDLQRLQDRTLDKDWGRFEKLTAQSLDDLKPWIHRGIPVQVGPMALTPEAHPLYQLVNVFAVTGQIPKSWVQPKGPISGMLGTMVPLDVFSKIQEKGINFNYVRESVTATSRVLVGYDDVRKVVILNDASFGPGWEVSYEDFDRMWAAGERTYVIKYPHNFAERSAQRSVSQAMPRRTAEQQAIEAYIMGYGLAAAGQPAEAETQFRKGLAIPGTSRGMQHLLQFELAGQLLCCRGRVEEGMAAFEQAIALVPENSAPWYILTKIFSRLRCHRNQLWQGEKL